MPSAFTCTRAAVVLFTVNSAIAMLLYPGGTFRDRSTAGYQFSRNFLSDLGMPKGWGGEPNLPGMILFVAAELAVAAALVGFFVAILRLSAAAPSRAWVRASAMAGGAAVLGIVGAAVTPADRLFQIHNQSALLAFRALFLMTAFLAVAVGRDPRFSRGVATLSALAAVLMAGYVGVLEWGPGTRTDDGLFVQVTAQKIAVATLLCWFYALSREAGRMAAPARTSSRAGLVESGAPRA